MDVRWNKYSTYLRAKYSKPVWRVGVDAGFSCPGNCIYCDEMHASAAYQRPQELSFAKRGVLMEDIPSKPLPDSLQRQVERGMAFLRRIYKAELFSLYFQAASNTYGSVDFLRKTYDEGLACYPDFKELIIATRPDCVDDEKAELIASYSNPSREVWVELGLQSSCDRTLEFIRRGHTSAQWLEAADLLRARGIKVCTHVILGLPGEGEEENVATARFISGHTDAVKLHNLHILSGTGLCELYRAGEVRLPDLDEYLRLYALFIASLGKNVVIERLLSDSEPHRLVAPRDFVSKNEFEKRLCSYMAEHDLFQGSRVC